MLLQVPIKLQKCAQIYPLSSIYKYPFYSRGYNSKWLSTQADHFQEKERVKPKVDVAIIGGGVVGCAAAYHLAKKGVRDLVLFERNELTSGSTWHAAGLTTYFHPGINLKRIHFNSLTLYKRLESETGQNVGLHTPGSIRIITNPTRMDEAKYQMSRQGWQQAEQHLISASEVYRMCPILAPGKVIGGIYTPGDGHIDPYSLTMALAKGARTNGAQILQQTQVTQTKYLKDSSEWEIHTNKGHVFHAKHIINAAGFFAREVAQLAGLTLPLVPIHHQYLVTARVPELEQAGFSFSAREMPVLRDLEGSYYARQERDGILFGPYEAVDKMRLCDDWVRTEVPAAFHKGRALFEPDVDRLQTHVEHAMNMLPCLKSAAIRRVIAGPITYSPEAVPLLGPYFAPNVKNYWVMAGFGYGIIQAGGAGEYIADWIVKGEPPFDLAEVDANRFGHWCNTDYAIGKARETYGLNNLVGYPKEERWTGRPTGRTSGIYALLRDHFGSQFGFHNGWEQPHWFAYPLGITSAKRNDKTTASQAKGHTDASYRPSFRRTNWFTPVGNEIDLVMNNVGLIDLSPFAKFTVRGPRAAEFLDLVCANSLPKVGRACVSEVCTPLGRVYGEVTLQRLAANDFLCVTGSGSELHDFRWFRDKAHELGYLKNGRDLQLENVTDELAVLGVAGPFSRHLLIEAMGPSGLSELDEDQFAFMDTRDISIQGVPVRALRISYTGELGWELYVLKHEMLRLFEILWAAGERLRTPPGLFGGFAMNSLRIEKGFRAWGSDMNMDTNPFEAGLDMFVKSNKTANFIGKEALQKMKKSGLKKKLMSLMVDTEGHNVDPEGNESVWYNGKVVGNTTSGAYGYNIKSSVAMAYLPVELANSLAHPVDRALKERMERGAEQVASDSNSNGSGLEVEILGERFPATVLAAPPLKPEQLRGRQKRDPLPPAL